MQKAQRMEALLRLLLSLQLDGWMGLQAADNSLGFQAIAAAVRGAASPVHGRGLFAAMPLAAGTIVSFYPARALGDATRRFQQDDSADIYGDTGHQPYRVALPASPGLLAWDADDLWVDTDPTGRDVSGWLAHLVNDACVCRSASEEDILSYYTCASAAANCRLVSFGDTPLICSVTTKDVEEGEELKGSYGHDYWCAFHSGSVPPYTEAVSEAERAWQAESSEWRRCIQVEYEREIAAVARLVQDVVYSGT